MNHNLYALFAQRFPAPSAPLLETEEGEIVTYGDIAQRAGRMAAVLAAQGARPGDRIAAQVEKSPDALALYLACLRGGFVYLPLNTAYQPPEIAYFLGDAEPAVFVCRPESLEALEPRARAAHVSAVLTLDGSGGGTFRDRVTHTIDEAPVHCVGADDLAIIIYTSGTTGRSKGAMLTHGNLRANGEALAGAWDFRSADVLLHQLPLFHVHGLFISTHCVLLSGARMLFHRKFDAAAALRALPGATVMMGVPTYYTRLLAEASFTRELARNVRLFVSGSAPLLMETFREFEARTGQRILERYGMSEAGVITSNPLLGDRKGGTVGRPLAGMEVRVAGEGDRLLPAGENGSVQIRGESVFKGYWRMPEKTREEFTMDGWFRTGDVGVWDADGYLSIVGRAKDLIISGGYNVYPKEIEIELDGLAGVVESAVIGVPHPDFGEAVTAVVILAPGAAFVEQEAIALLRMRLANYKVPKRIHVLPELPRNAMGKVQKNVLRDRFAEAVTGKA
ncbi:MAG: malonyl-CoA synthase [Betaproteobacteria bacterium]|nr:malonyl-CoA synthase [Betaproteobacteria bacterium]